MAEIDRDNGLAPRRLDRLSLMIEGNFPSMIPVPMAGALVIRAGDGRHRIGWRQP